MVLLGIKKNEVSQTEKDKYHMISLSIWNLKNNTSDSIYKTETDRHKEQTCGCQGGGGWGRDGVGVRD